MSIFMIETKKFIEEAREWEMVAETPVIATSVVEALKIVNGQFSDDQYSHRAILQIEVTEETVSWTYY